MQKWKNLLSYKKKRRWCKVIKNNDGCKKKRCCLKKVRSGKTVFLKCRNGRTECKIQRKTICHRRRIGKCHNKRCCQFTFSHRSKRWVINQTSCKYHKTCKNRKIRCAWKKLKNGCAQRNCIKKFFKNRKLLFLKKWQNKKICFEKRRFKCSHFTTSNGCKRKNCCLTLSFEGKIISKRCRDHNEVCPTIVKRKCEMRKLKNECKRRVCCVFKKKEENIVQDIVNKEKLNVLLFLEIDAKLQKEKKMFFKNMLQV